MVNARLRVKVIARVLAVIKVRVKVMVKVIAKARVLLMTVVRIRVGRESALGSQ